MKPVNENIVHALAAGVSAAAVTTFLWGFGALGGCVLLMLAAVAEVLNGGDPRI